MIHAVDGKNVAGFVLANMIDTAQPAYKFRVWRPPYDAVSAERMAAGIMDTLKLQKVVQGKTLPKGPEIKYISHAGRQVSDSDARERIRLARAHSSSVIRSEQTPPGQPAG